MMYLFIKLNTLLYSNQCMELEKKLW